MKIQQYVEHTSSSRHQVIQQQLNPQQENQLKNANNLQISAINLESSSAGNKYEASKQPTNNLQINQTYGKSNFMKNLINNLNSPMEQMWKSLF